MRITNKMMSNTFLRDMRSNLNNMSKLQQQLTSGKEIRRASDDPFKAVRAMQLYTDINTNVQHNSNISDITNWLDSTDTALDQAGNALQKVRELLISAGNASYGTGEKGAIKDEINQKVAELSQVLNTNFDGQYIFAGNRGTAKPTDTQLNASGNTDLFYCSTAGTPLTTADPEYSMIGQKLKVEISQGVEIDYNVSAKDIMEFKSGGIAVSLRDVFKNITDHLDGTGIVTSPATTPDDMLIGVDLENITDAINNLLTVRAQVGAKQNRMDSAKNMNVDQNFNMTEILSGIEDIDVAEKTMDFGVMQTVYMASLQTSAKVIQPTLMDYLR